MGGNAIPQAVRMTPFQYAAAVSFVRIILQPFVDKMGATRKFRDKESHGDIDVVLVLKEEYVLRDIQKLFPISFGSGKNLSVGLQMDFGVVQIDFFSVGNEMFENSLAYYSYGCFSCAMTICLAQYSLSYSWKGLSIRLSLSLPLHDDHKMKYSSPSPPHTDEFQVTVFLSSDFIAISEFLGLDSGRFFSDQSFNEAQLCEFMFASPFFSPSLLVDRAKTVHRLSNISNHMQVLQTYGPLPDPISFFNKEVEVEESIEKEKKRRQMRDRFNGRVVEDATALSGVVLGKFITSYKADKYNFEEFVLQSNEENSRKDLADCARVFIEKDKKKQS
eukprot:CAMPEP_0182418856 /NCGR_PEP_ID=MMETSP1167-20130531/3231_1 /TAXON_ID=2988 /ORGANISM="Mallomonas Sp, Strain CCMP3275" /LENGTH=331 /DNA_ID=CAMNT_0024593299 /DNA_START=229 /DNA_END=1224 /DNA_ORIENTATION=+